MQRLINLPALFIAATMPLVYWVVWRVLTGPFTPEIQSLVIGGVMGAGLNAAANYAIGSSHGSLRKTEAAEARAGQLPLP